MTAIEQAIKEAVEHGYPRAKVLNDEEDSLLVHLLSPLFWQAYAKAKKLDNPDEGICAFSGDWVPRNPAFLADCSCHREACLRWDTLWYRFIDKLASSGTAEEFFRELQSGTDLV